MKEKKNILNLAMIILTFIFNVLLITTLELIVKIPINKFGFVFSVILTLIEMFFLLKKQNNKIKNIIINLGIFLIILFISIFVAGNICDCSFDGNTYHKTAIGQLKNGWNPFYESLKEFNQSEKNVVTMNRDQSLWTDHYAKGIWYFAANVYSITGNIESGKCLSLLIAVVTFIFAYTVFSNKFRKVLSILLSVLIAFNPVFISQFMTYYNDAILGNCIIILIFILTMIIDKDYESRKINNFILLGMTLVILINIKFTGFAYAGIYCLFYYIYTILNKEERKRNLKMFTITGIVAVIIGACIIGYPTYIKNTIEHGNPFYPLMGEGKIDIMINNTPTGFLEMNKIKRFTVSTFSKAYNTSNKGEKLYEFKLPFTFYADELSKAKNEDTRVGGYGVFFSGILLSSFISGLFALVVLIKKRKNIVQYIIPVIATTFLIIIFDECWWARYIPQLYLLPFIVLAMLEEIKKINIVKYIKYFILFFIVMNIYLSANIICYDMSTKYLENESAIEAMRNSKETVYVNIGRFTGSLFNIADNAKEYQIVSDGTVLEEYTMYEFLNEKVCIYVKE